MFISYLLWHVVLAKSASPTLLNKIDLENVVTWLSMFCKKINYIFFVIDYGILDPSAIIVLV